MLFASSAALLDCLPSMLLIPLTQVLSIGHSVVNLKALQAAKVVWTVKPLWDYIAKALRRKQKLPVHTTEPYWPPLAPVPVAEINSRTMPHQSVPNTNISAALTRILNMMLCFLSPYAFPPKGAWGYEAGWTWCETIASPLNAFQLSFAPPVLYKCFKCDNYHVYT